MRRNPLEEQIENLRQTHEQKLERLEAQQKYERQLLLDQCQAEISAKFKEAAQVAEAAANSNTK
jgi:hypothetical protein